MKQLYINIIISIIFIIVLCLPLNSAAADSSNDIYTSFFKQIETVKEWEELNKLRVGYPDDGVFAELFSEKVEWLFKNRYSEFFSKAIYKDNEFYLFIKRHVDDTWRYGSDRDLAVRLESSCPEGHGTTCSDLVGLIIRNRQ